MINPKFSSTIIILGSLLIAACSNSPFISLPAETATPPIVLPEQSDDSRLLIDETNIYWIVEHGDNCQSSDIMMMSKAGASPIIMAEKQFCPRNLMVDQSYLYWVAGDEDRHIVRLPKSGGELVTIVSLAPGQRHIGGFTLDDENIYWLLRWQESHPDRVGALMVTPKAGGESSLLVDGQDTLSGSTEYGLFVDDFNVYWVVEHAIRKVSKSGGEPITLVEAYFQPYIAALDDTNIYYYSTNGTYLMRISKDGGESVTLVVPWNGAAVTISDSYIYWIDTQGLKRIATDGGTPGLVVFEPILADTASIVADTSSNYWLRDPNRTLKPISIILDIPSPSDPGNFIAFEQDGINSLAVDSSSIYWTTCKALSDISQYRFQGGAVRFISKEGGEVISLYESNNCLRNIGVAADTIYFVEDIYDADNNFTKSALVAITKQGSPTTWYSSPSHILTAVMDEDILYLGVCHPVENGCDGKYLVVTEPGGSPTILATSQSPAHLVIDTQNIYWIDGPAMMKAPKSGGTPVVVVSSLNDVSGLVSDETSLYWLQIDETSSPTSCQHSSSSVYSMPKEGGNPLQLARFDGQWASNLTIDDNYVYWTEGCSEGITKIAKTGGDPISFADEYSYALSPLVLDNTSVYWIENYYQGGVVRISK
jgi:hypothetical protein